MSTPPETPSPASGRQPSRAPSPVYVPTAEERKLLQNLQEELLTKSAVGFIGGMAVSQGFVYWLKSRNPAATVGLFPRVAFTVSTGAMVSLYWASKILARHMDLLVQLDHKMNPVALQTKTMLRDEYNWNPVKKKDDEIEITKKT